MARFKSLALAAVVALAATAVFAAGTARAEMVVVATTAPNVDAGRVVAGGERLDLPVGTSVTLLGPDGRSLTLLGPGGVVPADDEVNAAEDLGLLRALAGLVGGGTGGAVMAAVRGIERCAPAAAAEGRSEVARIAVLAGRGCIIQARAELDALVARIAPPGLRLTSDAGDRPVYRVGDRLVLRAQPNFDAHLYCYYRQVDGRVIPIFPDDDPAEARIPGNRPTELPVDLKIGWPTGTEVVSCFATGRDVGGELPPPLVGRPFESLPDDVARRLPAIFQGLGVAPLAEAQLVIEVRP